jgi:hypothetical protein
MGRSTGKDSIAMISKVAIVVFYQNLLGLNVLTIKLEQ